MEDPISTRTFTQPSEAARFVNDKAEDYRYTLGRVWQEEYVRKA